jgi:DNA polymerase-3 subunit alpha
MYLRYYTPAAFMSALINSYSKDKDRMVDAVSSARERVHLIPPNINQTQEGFGVEDGQMLFGLRGIKGMGAANRLEILRERDANGSFASFDDFCLRLPSVPVPMKLSLVRAGAFDNLVSRELLMATCPKKGKSDAQWTVAEHLNHNRSLKNPRPIPDIEELHFPTDEEMAEAERDTTGFYVSRSPLGEVEAVLRRCDTAKTIGGRIESIQRKKDRRGQEMAMIRLLTPDLKQRRVIIFASNWPALKPYMNKGEQWIMRGRHDGDSFLAEVAWPPYDMEHFRRAEVTHPDSSTESVRLNGGTSDLVAAWEAQGCSVRLR